MMFFVDTSVWSLALCRDIPGSDPEVAVLPHALELGERAVTTGLALQELLQGLGGPMVREDILSDLPPLPFLEPARREHDRAAEVRNSCR